MSVLQYFPNMDYVVRVLEGAAQVVQPGGFMFLSDVRSLPLLEAFHTSVQLSRAPASLSIGDLQHRVRNHIQYENQLVIDPAFFQSLPEYIPQITRVDIQLERGRRRNELTNFRYDVVLHIGVEVGPHDMSEALDWESNHLTLDAVCQALRCNRPELLRLTHIPNARVWKDVQAMSYLAAASCKSVGAKALSRLTHLGLGGGFLGIGDGYLTESMYAGRPVGVTGAMMFNSVVGQLRPPAFVIRTLSRARHLVRLRRFGNAMPMPLGPQA